MNIKEYFSTLNETREFDLYVSNKPAGDFWDANKRTDYKIKITF